MADKKYYWLRLDRNFFKRHDIRIIEEQPNGKDYILFYLKLLVESIDHEGHLRFSDTIPYDEKMLSVVTNTNIDIVRSSIKIFNELKLMEIFDDKTIYMAETNKMLGESTSTHRVQAFREKQRLLKIETQGNVTETLHETEIELEKELEIDKEKEKDFLKEYSDFSSPEIIKKSVSKTFIRPSFEEVKAYCDERNNNVNPQKWFDYYSSNGWKVGKNSMKDWKAAVRTWESSDGRNSTSKPKTFEDEITARVKRMNQYMGVNVDETK